jgi:hypothetical protein
MYRYAAAFTGLQRFSPLGFGSGKFKHTSVAGKLGEHTIMKAAVGCDSRMTRLPFKSQKQP